ncbi:MAG: transposase [Armatimonadota bacterium]
MEAFRWMGSQNARSSGVARCSSLGDRASCNSQIKGLLFTLYGLSISKGEISRILQRVADVAMPLYEKIRDEVRGSSVVHADETGWRQDGVNGYIWSFSTPSVRYFVYNRSRASDITQGSLG